MTKADAEKMFNELKTVNGNKSFKDSINGISNLLSETSLKDYNNS